MPCMYGLVFPSPPVVSYSFIFSNLNTICRHLRAISVPSSGICTSSACHLPPSACHMPSSAAICRHLRAVGRHLQPSVRYLPPSAGICRYLRSIFRHLRAFCACHLLPPAASAAIFMPSAHNMQSSATICMPFALAICRHSQPSPGISVPSVAICMPSALTICRHLRAIYRHLRAISHHVRALCRHLPPSVRRTPHLPELPDKY